jgi:hypothetical protein
LNLKTYPRDFTLDPRFFPFLKENRSRLKDKLTLISLKMGGIGVKEIVKILIE